MNDIYEQWTQTTAELPWGVQHAFHDVLTLAAEESVTLVYGADYYNQGACLVNQAANLLITGGGHGIPMASFGPVVSLFDQINRELYHKQVNPNGMYVSPMAAEILLRYFAPLKPIPEKQGTLIVDENTTFVEPTDEEFAGFLQEMLTTEPPVEPEQYPAISESPEFGEVSEETAEVYSRRSESE